MNINVKFVILALFISGCVLPGFAQEKWLKNLNNQDWLEKVDRIELLKSNKSDVEKILGKPGQYAFPTDDFIQNYSIANGRATVLFTRSDCTAGKGRKIPKGVVEELRFAPSKEVKLTDLNLPLSKFKMTRESDAPSIEIYINSENGIEIEVQNGNISGINFTPARRVGVVCDES